MKKLFNGLFILIGLMLACTNLFPIAVYYLGGDWYKSVNNLNYSIAQALTCLWIICIISHVINPPTK